MAVGKIGHPHDAPRTGRLYTGGSDGSEREAWDGGDEDGGLSSLIRGEVILVVFVWCVIAVMLGFMCSARAREAASWSHRRWMTGGPPELPVWDQGHGVRAV